jgi:hypothetical protein
MAISNEKKEYINQREVSLWYEVAQMAARDCDTTKDAIKKANDVCDAFRVRFSQAKGTIQSLGGITRAQRMTPEERSAVAKTGAVARWNKSLSQTPVLVPVKRVLSDAGRRNIREGQKRRWARIKKGKYLAPKKKGK